jgi:hypothetical protein
MQAMVKARRVLVGWLVAGMVAALVYAGIYLPVSRKRNEAYLNEARSNLRSMSCAMGEFDSEYGAFPNAETAKRVVEVTESKLQLGDGSANEIFRQLIASEICNSEGVFYAKIPGTRKPDHDFSKPGKALTKGEVGYSYILGQSSRSPVETPLVVTPLVPGTNRFDPKPFKGMAVIMRVGSTRNGSIDVLPINSRGEVIDSSGKHLLSADHPLWGGKAPVIVWPE